MNEGRAAVGVEDVDSHDIGPDGDLTRREDVVVVEREGVFVFSRGIPESVVTVRFEERVVCGRVGDPVDRLGGPRLEDGLATVDAESAVDQGDGAPRSVVARAEDADELRVVVGERPRVDHAAGGRRVVAPVDFMLRAVGVRDPDALRVAEVAVDVFPAVVDDASVGKERGMSFKERAFADLLDVGAVRVHLVEVAHDVAVAHAVFRLAGRGEDDFARRKIDGVDIAGALDEGELAVSVDLLQVVDGHVGAEDDRRTVVIERDFGDMIVVVL